VIRLLLSCGALNCLFCLLWSRVRTWGTQKCVNARSFTPRCLLHNVCVFIIASRPLDYSMQSFPRSSFLLNLVTYCECLFFAIRSLWLLAMFIVSLTFLLRTWAVLTRCSMMCVIVLFETVGILTCTYIIDKVTNRFCLQLPTVRLAGFLSIYQVQVCWPLSDSWYDTERRHISAPPADQFIKLSSRRRVDSMHHLSIQVRHLFFMLPVVIAIFIHVGSHELL
jgi:hypothetical protein